MTATYIHMHTYTTTDTYTYTATLMSKALIVVLREVVKYVATLLIKPFTLKNFKILIVFNSNCLIYQKIFY